MEENKEYGVEYSVFRNPSKAGKDTLHARLAKGKTISEETLYKEMAARSKYSSSDIKGMLEAFRTVLAFRLSYGEAVELKGLGTFSLSLKSDPVTTEEELIPKKVHFGRVAFKASRSLTKELKNIKFVRCNDGSRLKQFSPEQRREKLLNHLETHETFYTNEYQSINHCSKYLALKDIKVYLKEGLIKQLGHYKHPLYQLADRE